MWSGLIVSVIHYVMFDVVNVNLVVSVVCVMSDMVVVNH